MLANLVKEMKQNSFDEKQWNIWAYQTMALDGRCINLTKKINAYLKKNNIGFDKTIEYLKQYNTEEFDDFIREQYEIKGEVTPVKIMSAKKKSEDNIPLEKDEQKRLCKWLKENKIGHFATGIGVKLGLDVKYVASLKSQGHYSGIPDLVVLLGNGKMCFVELKRQKGGVVSEEQKKWIDYLNNNGYPAKVCKGADEAIEFIKKESEVNNEI